MSLFGTHVKLSTSKGIRKMGKPFGEFGTHVKLSTSKGRPHEHWRGVVFGTHVKLSTSKGSNFTLNLHRFQRVLKVFTAWRIHSVFQPLHMANEFPVKHNALLEIPQNSQIASYLMSSAIHSDIQF